MKRLQQGALSKLAAILLLLVTAGFTGCDNKDDFVVTTINNNNNVPVVTTGQVVINNTLLARALPTTVTSLTYRGLLNSSTVFESTNQPRQAQTTLNGVPLNIDTFVMELLVNGDVIGRFTDTNPTFVNGVYTINDPAWVDVFSTKSAADLNGTYALHGADAVNFFVKGATFGTLTFDGAGGITAGSYTAQELTATPFVFTVASGTYTVAANGDFSATLTTDQYTLNLTGRMTNDKSGVWTVVSGNDGTLFGSREVGIAHLQPVPAAGSFSNSSLNGTYNTSLAYLAQDNFPPADDPPGAYLGTLVLQGDGNIGASTLTAIEANVPNIGITSGTYTVAANGNVTGQIVFNNALGTQNFTGQIGPDGTFSLGSFTGGAALTDQFFATASKAPVDFTQANASTDFFVAALNLTSQFPISPGVIAGPLSAPNGTVTATTLNFDVGNMTVVLNVNSGTLTIGTGSALTNSSLNVSFTVPMSMDSPNGTLRVEGFTFQNGTGGFGGLNDDGALYNSSIFNGTPPAVDGATDMFGVIVR